MLSKANHAFDDIPSDTNAVESHNRVSKGSAPDVLKVALMTTYKVDMAAALEHLAQGYLVREPHTRSTLKTCSHSQ